MLYVCQADLVTSVISVLDGSSFCMLTKHVDYVYDMRVGVSFM